MLAPSALLLTWPTGLPTLSAEKADHVASAGKISSLDPAQASTVNTIQLLSTLGDPLHP